MAIITNQNKPTFQEGDGVSAVVINNVIDTCVNANDIATKLTQQPDYSEADNVGLPSVEIGENGNFVFKNLKGNQGNQGVKGDKGTEIYFNKEYNSQSIYYNNQDRIDVVYYNGSSYIPKSTSVGGYLPTNTTYWNVFVLKGSDGIGGNVTVTDFSSLQTGKAYALRVNSTANNVVSATLEEVPTIEDVVLKAQGTSNANKHLVIDNTGNVTSKYVNYIEGNYSLVSAGETKSWAIDYNGGTIKKNLLIIPENPDIKTTIVLKGDSIKTNDYYGIIMISFSLLVSPVSGKFILNAKHYINNVVTNAVSTLGSQTISDVYINITNERSNLKIYEL